MCGNLLQRIQTFDLGRVIDKKQHAELCRQQIEWEIMSEKALRESVNLYLTSVNAKETKDISKACHLPHFRVMGNNNVYP